MRGVTQAERENLEIRFWEESDTDGPNRYSIYNVINKMSEVGVFVSEVKRFQNDFDRSQSIIELGGGQLWSSCLVKALYPQKELFGTDIGEAAIASASLWEDVFRVKLDHRFSCKSYDIPLPNASCDLVFAFQAAHHFGDHARTFAEVSRILKPQGVLLYLGEPVCSKLTYKIAFERVNRMRPEVHEDLLILKDMRRHAEQNGMVMSSYPRADIIHPTMRKALYYAGLNAVPVLRNILPSAMSLRFEKR